jgi:recombinational DNA repair ATPase RecF
MKIKTIQIAGFRGVPPVSPPDVNIDLTSVSGGLKNLLLFGPNAYGKSSIADALEWFFKESIRCSSYFEEFCDTDNIHVKLGQPGFITEAYIEIVVEHNGTNYTLRKDIDQSGVKIRENLNGIPITIQQLENEIIVLDHDQFRKFVSAANSDKWTSFSSLIGYEELDFFRSGIDSLSSRSLTDSLHKTQLEAEVNQKKQKWETDLTQAINRYDVKGNKLEDLRSNFQTNLEVTLSSLGLMIPSSDENLSNEYWEGLRNQVKAPEAITQASTRLGELQTLLGKLTPFPDDFANNLVVFSSLLAELEQRKSNFDKKILSDFYQLGKQVIEEKKSTPDECPFCGTTYLWESLYLHVQEQHNQLDFSEIEQQHKTLISKWGEVKQIITDRRIMLSTIDLSMVKEAFKLVGDTSVVDAAIRLNTFDSITAETWVKNAKSLDQIITDVRKTVENEKVTVEESLKTNPVTELQEKIEGLVQIWNTVQILSNDLITLQKLQRKLTAVEQVVEYLRNTTSRFRNELNDFSVRVVHIINDDVKAYYHELHPDDRIKPFLDVSVHGNQRVVSLRCDYRGILNRAAVTLLSESHRNSLGMAILLAFMKYKRQTGSPVGFCVFDDVTQSFDTEHRTNLLTLLENPRFPEISQQQIIFMTHDRTLADLVKRPGELSLRENWLRVDIRNWWLERMVLESEKEIEPLVKAQQYIINNDEIAAGIYVRRALEQLYKTILFKASIRVQYSDKPWMVSLEDYRKFIFDEISELWIGNYGFIDPNEALFQSLFTSQRILNLTVHDSQFLDNPMTLGDVQAALNLVQQLKTRFTCQSCGKYYHTVRKSGVNNPVCNGRTCNNQLV